MAIDPFAPIPPDEHTFAQQDRYSNQVYKITWKY